MRANGVLAAMTPHEYQGERARAGRPLLTPRGCQGERGLRASAAFTPSIARPQGAAKRLLLGATAVPAAYQPHAQVVLAPLEFGIGATLDAQQPGYAEKCAMEPELAGKVSGGDGA